MTSWRALRAGQRGDSAQALDRVSSTDSHVSEDTTRSGGSSSGRGSGSAMGTSAHEDEPAAGYQPDHHHDQQRQQQRLHLHHHHHHHHQNHNDDDDDDHKHQHQHQHHHNNHAASKPTGGGGGGGKLGAGLLTPAPPRPAGSRQLLIVILFLVGLTVCVSSLASLLLLPRFVSQQIAKKLVLRNNSMLLERWSKPNVPMYFKVWLYDIKNAQELVERRETRPRVEEIGPFVFNLRRQKDVISFAGDNLYYTERKIYHFNRELSCCAINTTITIPNIPLVAVVDRALSYNLPLVGRFVPRLINRAIQSLREQLFVRKQARELLFDGYDVELLRMVSRVGSLVGLPQQSQRFALLKGRNDTWRPEQDGVWAINTGQRDRRHFGRVSSWNSYKRLPFWAEHQCNTINGSDGTLFPPPIKPTEPLYIFNQELCRTVNLVFERPSDVRAIKALRFVLNPLNFAHTMAPGSGLAASAAAAAGAAAAAVGAPVSGASTGPGFAQAAAAANGSAAPANAQRAARINPIFTNRDRLAPARPNEPLDPVAILGVSVQPPPPPPSSVQPALARPRQQTGGAGGGGGGASSGQPRPSALPAHARQHQADPLRPSASEARAARRESVAAQAAQPADARAETTAKMAAEDKIRREQERFIEAAQEAQLANERKTQPNPQACFCDRKQTNLNGVGVCEFDGLIDLSKCSKQAQVIFGSMPHFYNSDPRLLRQVSGLAPNASKHTTYLDIEPNTGLVLGGKRRVQLNVIIKHNNEIDGFENINDMLVPIVWFEESAMIPEETAQKFRAMYVDRIRMVNYILFSLLMASIALLAIDARLALSSFHWRQHFKWRLTSASGAGGGNAHGHKSGSSSASPSSFSASSAASSSTPLSMPMGLHRHSAASRRPQLMQADAPLLQHSRSSLGSATPDEGSPHATPPETPEGSPELRKWSTAQRAPANTTRVYLNGALDNRQQQQQQQQQ